MPSDGTIPRQRFDAVSARWRAAEQVVAEPGASGCR